VNTVQDFCNSFPKGKAILTPLSSAQLLTGNEEVWRLGERSVALMQTQAVEESLGRLALTLLILLM
jgi:phage host-nuclease inhibitor protein Gam